MAQLTRTGWGQRFMDALQSFTDPARLARGRSYAGPNRIRSHTLRDGKLTARVQGNINPYFGVYKVPAYTTSVELAPLSEAQWRRIIPSIVSRASLVTQLLMNEMPAGLEDVLRDGGGHLLPVGEKDFKTQCSCPDFWNPCKHIAGLCYLLARELDQDPFLLFELRGLSRQHLRQELLKSPLGQVSAQALVSEEPPIEPAETYYNPAATSPRHQNRIPRILER